MAAPEGNQFWKARSSHGCKPAFSSPDGLWSSCVEYFEWVDSHPLWETKSYMYQGKPVQDTIPKMRAMTIEGLCIFLEIGASTWYDYRGKKEFSDIVSKVEMVIRTQKFAGAAADMLNANIIARDLGLADKAELTGESGGPLKIIINSKDNDL